jgi:hypothetical protein
MKVKFWLCKRGKNVYSYDSETGERKSLDTFNREQANQLIRAKNDSVLWPAPAKSSLKPAAIDPRGIADKGKNHTRWSSMG